MGLSLPGALEVAAIMMGGGMYFAARYGQSTSDDLLLAQGQDLTDVKRFLYQTVINLLLVSPIMVLVLAAGPIAVALGASSLVLLSAALLAVALAYTVLILNYLLSAAGRSLRAREDPQASGFFPPNILISGAQYWVCDSNMQAVAKLSEIPVGTMKRVKAFDHDVLLSNVGGKVYATQNNCGHQRARPRERDSRGQSRDLPAAPRQV